MTRARSTGNAKAEEEFARFAEDLKGAQAQLADS
jgi:hypothetical protein